MGRTADLESLHEVLQKREPVGIRPTGLSGMGGIGKTQLAVEYAYRHKADYPGGIFWVNATEPLEQGLAQLGTRLRPETIDQPLKQQTRIAFEELKQRPNSLIIFDNLDDPAELARPVGPEESPLTLGCRLLFTTRRRELGRFHAVEIAVLPDEPAAVTRPGFWRDLLDRLCPRLHDYLTRVGACEEPPELKALRGHLDNVVAQIENEIRRKAYIPLDWRDVPSPHEPDPIQQLILILAGRAHGGEGVSAEIGAASRRSWVVRNLLRLIKHSRDPLMLLGEPGGGKTMTLLKAAWCMAEAEKARVFPVIPLCIRLGEFHVEGKPSAEDVMNYVVRAAPKSIRPWIPALAQAQRLVIFFDGMDEMSRERYGKHTEALSLFAGSRRRSVKTLFSCRITDFSPEFIHQQLVLLPFNFDQVSEFLRQYIRSFPIHIDGVLMSRKQLAVRIDRGDLSIEGNNPFVLWLLTLYLQRQTTWPTSRTELIQFYLVEIYRRKQDELSEEETSFPDAERAFLEWSRFAFLITLRNLGPTISFETLAEGQEPAVIKDMIRVGKLCGVVKETFTTDEHLVRFEHHRFQEYFTALYIHEAQPSIYWLTKLDAPRWQETMVNLILLEGATEPIQALIHAITSANEECLHVGKNLKTKSAELILPDELETELADRVELVSRIIRQGGTGATNVSRLLMPPFREAVTTLATHGNPISQVKMLRACQNVVGIEDLDALQTPSIPTSIGCGIRPSLCWGAARGLAGPSSAPTSPRSWDAIWREGSFPSDYAPTGGPYAARRPARTPTVSPPARRVIC